MWLVLNFCVASHSSRNAAFTMPPVGIIDALATMSASIRAGKLRRRSRFAAAARRLSAACALRLPGRGRELGVRAMGVPRPLDLGVRPRDMLDMGVPSPNLGVGPRDMGVPSADLAVARLRRLLGVPNACVTSKLAPAPPSSCVAMPKRASRASRTAFSRSAACRLRSSAWCRRFCSPTPRFMTALRPTAPNPHSDTGNTDNRMVWALWGTTVGRGVGVGACGCVRACNS